MSTYSYYKRKGFELYVNGLDPIDMYPYSKNAWDFQEKYEAFFKGWKEAEQMYTYREEEEAKELEAFDNFQTRCPWANWVKYDNFSTIKCQATNKDCTADECAVWELRNYWKECE